MSVYIYSYKLGEFSTSIDVGALEGPYIPESQRSWHPELIAIC